MRFFRWLVDDWGYRHQTMFMGSFTLLAAGLTGALVYSILWLG